MNWIDSVTTSLLSKDLDGLWARQRAISDNIANFETPGYRAKTVSFDDQLRDQIASGDGGTHKTIENIQNIQPVTTVAQDETYRADGNGVDLEQQNVELARTQLNYNYSLTELSDAFSRLKTAISGT